MNNHILQCSALDLLDHMSTSNIQAQMIFIDPPDNLGLNYKSYKDELPLNEYYGFIEATLLRAMKVSPIIWLSYYWKHNLEITSLIRYILKNRYPTWDYKPFIWRFTFGQYNSSDFGSGFRFIVRLVRHGMGNFADSVRVDSVRMLIGDNRGNPSGRIPDDFWCFDHPRVVGNSEERRQWHPTQHPEALIERIVKFSTQENDLVIDPFGGTFTTLRVCRRINRFCWSCDIDPEYCYNAATENHMCLTTDLRSLCRV